VFEVEQKYVIGDLPELLERIGQMGGTEQETQQHVDTYYNHPSRDFAQTGEALRLRRIDGVPMITYKGIKLPGEIKARREMEWRLDPGDPEGAKTEELWQVLGFRRVASVCKTRRILTLPQPFSAMTVVVDRVDRLGDFAEVEMIAADEDSVPDARRQISQLAGQLGLQNAEPRSYLRMILALDQAIY